MSDQDSQTRTPAVVLAGIFVVGGALALSWFSGMFTPIDRDLGEQAAPLISQDDDDISRLTRDKRTVVESGTSSSSEDQATLREKEAVQREELPPAQASVPNEPTIQGAPIAETGSQTFPAQQSADATTNENAGSSAEGKPVAPVAGEVVRPRFDLVRVEIDGSTIIAGRGGPGDEIVTELGGREVGRTTAARDGTFAQVLNLQISQAPQMIRLWVALPDGGRVYALEDAILAPSIVAVKTPDEAEKPNVEETSNKETETNRPLASNAQPVEMADVRAKEQPEGPVSTHSQPAQSDSGTEIQQKSAASRISETTETSTLLETQNSNVEPLADKRFLGQFDRASNKKVQALESETDEANPNAPAVLLAGNDGVRLLQTGDGSPEVMSAVALDTISYSESGEVQLSGRARVGGFVRVYINNKPITISKITADGSWRTDLPNVDNGIYTLRVDEVDDAGKVTSRVETPFKREAQSALVGAGQVTAITVQPGNTLWAIARENYGEGILYVRLYQANKDRIRNPDLIYPGQVFDIPRE